MAHFDCGAVSLSNSFLEYLKTEPVCHRLEPLLLGGRQEDYLVKEYMQFVHWRSAGRRFCEFGLGGRGEQKVDIALMRSSGREDREEIIEALIEVKYLQNRGRRSAPANEKYDEIRPTLSDLRRQIDLQPGDEHAGYAVDLRARRVKVYGLVFASYSRCADEWDGRKEFFGRMLDVAEELGFRYHDHPKPYLYSVCENRGVNVLGEEWLVSLRGGLWCLKTVR